MKLTAMEPPRVFAVGQDGAIRLKDCGRIELEPDEQLTFVTASGTEYDVARKSWGYYATPSLNGRLPSFGLRPALVRSYNDRFFLLLVERERIQQFEDYLQSQDMKLACWLDDAVVLERIEALSRGGAA